MYVWDTAKPIRGHARARDRAVYGSSCIFVIRGCGRRCSREIFIYEVSNAQKSGCLSKGKKEYFSLEFSDQGRRVLAVIMNIS